MPSTKLELQPVGLNKRDGKWILDLSLLDAEDATALTNTTAEREHLSQRLVEQDHELVKLREKVREMETTRPTPAQEDQVRGELADALKLVGELDRLARQSLTTVKNKAAASLALAKGADAAKWTDVIEAAKVGLKAIELLTGEKPAAEAAA